MTGLKRRRQAQPIQQRVALIKRNIDCAHQKLSSNTWS
jgi:hypothetical protein